MCLTHQVLPTGCLLDHDAGLCEVMQSYKAPAREIIRDRMVTGRQRVYVFISLLVLSRALVGGR